MFVDGPTPGPAQLAISEGDTTPIPSGVGVTAWSTTLNTLVVWNGTTWNATGGSSAVETLNPFLLMWA